VFGELMRDPAVRRAYVRAKAAVFVFAAALTWPLSRVMGPKAWIGLVVFGVVLAGLTIAVLAATKGPPVAPAADRDDDDDGDEEPLPEEVVSLPIEDFIDLHPFAPREIPEVVESYLEEAVARGFTEVRLIHGRGIGVQRERVRSVLADHPLIERYADAPPDRGGWGATIAWLRGRQT
jgi:hypothetical protein